MPLFFSGQPIFSPRPTSLSRPTRPTSLSSLPIDVHTAMPHPLIPLSTSSQPLLPSTLPRSNSSLYPSPPSISPRRAPRPCAERRHHRSPARVTTAAPRAARHPSRSRHRTRPRPHATAARRPLFSPRVSFLVVVITPVLSFKRRSTFGGAARRRRAAPAPPMPLRPPRWRL